MGEKGSQRSFRVIFERFQTTIFRDKSMCASGLISYLNMEGNSMFFVFLLCFWIRKRTTKNPIDIYAKKVTKVTLWMQTEISSSPASDNQFVLVTPKCEWVFDKRSKTWKLGRKLNKYYHVSLQCVKKKKNTLLAFQQLSWYLCLQTTPAAAKSVLFSKIQWNVSLWLTVI